MMFWKPGGRTDGRQYISPIELWKCGHTETFSLYEYYTSTFLMEQADRHTVGQTDRRTLYVYSNNNLSTEMMALRFLASLLRTV